MTVAVALGVLIDTTNCATLPSITVGLLTNIVGNPVMSIIVPVATKVVFTGCAVLLELIVAFIVNVSVLSLMVSVDVVTGTLMLVAPAGMVTVVDTDT